MSKSAGAHERAIIDKIGRTIRELRSFDVSAIQDRWDGRLEVLQRKVNTHVADVVGAGSPEYKKHAIPALDSALDSTFGERYTLGEFHDCLRAAIQQAIIRLDAVTKLVGERPHGEAASTATAVPAPEATAAPAPAPSPAPTAAPTPGVPTTSAFAATRRKDRNPIVGILKAPWLDLLSLLTRVLLQSADSAARKQSAGAQDRRSAVRS